MLTADHQTHNVIPHARRPAGDVSSMLGYEQGLSDVWFADDQDQVFSMQAACRVRFGLEPFRWPIQRRARQPRPHQRHAHHVAQGAPLTLHLSSQPPPILSVHSLHFLTASTLLLVGEHETLFDGGRWIARAQKHTSGLIQVEGRPALSA